MGETTQPPIVDLFERAGREIGIFRHLDRNDRLEIASSFERLSYPAGATCWEEGTEMDFLGVVTAGELEVKRGTDLPGRPVLLAVLSAGSHVGEFSALENRRSFGTVTATMDSELLIIHREKLESFINTHPRAGNTILKGIAGVLSIRLQKAIEKVIALS